MKQFNIQEKRIGENTYYLRPFPAMYGAVISGKLASVVAPIIGELGPAIGAVAKSGTKPNAEKESDADGKLDLGSIDISNLEIDDVLPAIGAALSHLDGDKIESLIRDLLINGGNVSVCGSDTDGDTLVLNQDLVNEIFCGELQDMLLLCYEVIRMNYKGFFKKLADQFGGLRETTQVTLTQRSGASLT